MDLKGEFILPVITLLAGWVFKMMWDSIKEKNSSTLLDMKDLNRAINALSISFSRLEIQVEHLNKLLSITEENRRDLDKLGARVRELHKLGNGHD